MIEGSWRSETTRERITAMAVLRTLLGVRLATGMAVHDCYSHGEGLPATGGRAQCPFSNSDEEVAVIAPVCDGAEMPATPFGAGILVEARVAVDPRGIVKPGRMLNESQLPLSLAQVVP